MPRGAMTDAQDTRRGTTYMVTRRITRRHFLLRPDEDGTLQNLYWYFAAVMARELGVVVHCVQVLSNHIHEVVTDTRGNLPRFYELRNRMLAVAVKEHRDQWPEEVMSRSPINYVELLTPGAIAKEVAYVMANCVSSFLVRTPRRWPGPKVLVDDMGRRVVRARRPDAYVDPTNPQWPETAELDIVIPEQLVAAYGSEDGARAAVAVVLEAKLREAHAEAKRKGRAFLGAKRVLRTPFNDRARSEEEPRTRFPRFAAAGDARAIEAWYERRERFLSDYGTSLARLRKGHANTVFPYGTWKMRYHYNVRCHPPPT